MPESTSPTLCYSMDVNALNYCRFSLMPVSATSEKGEARALLALPNLVESSLVRGSDHKILFGVLMLKYCPGLRRQTFGNCLLGIDCTLL